MKSETQSTSSSTVEAMCSECAGAKKKKTISSTMKAVSDDAAFVIVDLSDAVFNTSSY